MEIGGAQEDTQEDKQEDTHVQQCAIDCLQMRGFRIEILNGLIAAAHTYVIKTMIYYFRTVKPFMVSPKKTNEVSITAD